MSTKAYFVGIDIILASALEFKAKTESVTNLLPKSFTVMVLKDYVLFGL